MIPSPQIGPREILYTDKYQQIYRVSADFGSFQKEYFVRDTGQRVGIVIIKGNLVLLVRQYRLLIGDISWEIPGGRVEPGETPEEAAHRECLEEAGLKCQSLNYFFGFQAGLDALHNPTYLFYANHFTKVHGWSGNKNEVIQNVWVPLQQSLEMVSNHKISDSLSIIGLLTYQNLGSTD